MQQNIFPYCQYKDHPDVYKLHKSIQIYIYMSQLYIQAHFHAYFGSLITCDFIIS